MGFYLGVKVSNGAFDGRVRVDKLAKRRRLDGFTDETKKAMLAAPDYFAWWYTAKSIGLGVVAAYAAYQFGLRQGRQEAVIDVTPKPLGDARLFRPPPTPAPAINDCSCPCHNDGKITHMGQSCCGS